MKLKSSTTSRKVSSTLSDGAKRWVPNFLQKRAAPVMVKQGAVGILADPGVGKTSLSLKVYQILRAANQVKAGLVIAPNKRVARNVWPKEAADWPEFSDIKVRVLHGSKKDFEATQPADLYVITVDGMKWLLEKGWKLLPKKPDLMIVDESTKFKRTNTLRFKLMKELMPKFYRRWILTGTPMPKSYMDLFGQIYILDAGAALGRYITHYRMEYFDPLDDQGWAWALKEGAEKRIQKRIQPLVVRLDNADYLNMPQVDNVIRVSLDPKARAVYESMEEQLFAELDKSTRVTATNAGAAHNKCCQIANGAVYTREIDYDTMTVGDDYEIVHSEKIEALAELIEELQGSPLLVAYEFTHDAERIVDMLGAAEGLSYAWYSSSVNDKRAAEIEDAWNAGKLDVLLTHPASTGHGLNLQKSNCRNVAFFGIPWDYELYDQLIRRVRRQGNTSRFVRVHHIVATATVDEAKMISLADRGKAQRTFLDAMKAYRRKLLQ